MIRVTATCEPKRSALTPMILSLMHVGYSKFVRRLRWATSIKGRLCGLEGATARLKWSMMRLLKCIRVSTFSIAMTTTIQTRNQALTSQWRWLSSRVSARTCSTPPIRSSSTRRRRRRPRCPNWSIIMRTRASQAALERVVGGLSIRIVAHSPLRHRRRNRRMMWRTIKRVQIMK